MEHSNSPHVQEFYKYKIHFVLIMASLTASIVTNFIEYHLISLIMIGISGWYISNLTDSAIFFNHMYYTNNDTEKSYQLLKTDIKKLSNIVLGTSVVGAILSVFSIINFTLYLVLCLIATIFYIFYRGINFIKTKNNNKENYVK